MYSLLLIFYQISTLAALDTDVSHIIDLISTATVQATTYQVRTNNSDLLGNSSPCDPVVDFGTFDFIVVGASASGAAVASRLSENPNWQILLLEAGADNDELTYVPYYNGLLSLSDRNWGFTTTPQTKGCLGRINKQCPIVTGKVLGGTTLFNNFHIRGSQQDYNDWASLGNPGWSYEELLPYFRRVENFTISNNDTQLHGSSGPITVSFIKPASLLNEQLFNGFENAGIPMNEDYNGAEIFGAARLQYALKDGRLSSAVDYITPALNRSNFNLTLNAFVTKVMIHSYNKTTHGVQFVKAGITYSATMRKELILSTGSVMTSQLLKLSGVGPKSELIKNHIPVIKNLPVGLGLKCKLLFSVYFKSNVTASTTNLSDVIQDFLDGEGLLTTVRSQRLFATLYSNGSKTINPNMQIVVSYPREIADPPSFTNFKVKTAQSIRSQVNYTNTFQFNILFTRPFSQGALTLRSNDVRDFPDINPNMLSDSRDIQAIYEGVQLILKIAAQLRKIGIELALFVPISDCDGFRNGTRKFWYCVIQQLAFPNNFPSGTISMGPTNDPFSVVNNELQVYDIHNLRVVDYAVVPLFTNGNGGTIGYIIGEKAADLLKYQYCK